VIDQAIARFLNHLKYIQGSAKNTILAYSTDLNQFRDVVRRELGGSFLVQDLQSEEVGVYADWMSEREFAPTTIARKMAALRSFFQYLNREEGVNLSHLSNSTSTAVPERSVPRSLSGKQIQRLLEAPSDSHSPRDIRDAAILGLLYATGLRSAEAASLTLHDLDLQRGMLDRPGSNSVPLPLGVSYHSVERYVKEGRPQLMRDRTEQALFLNQRGRGLSRQGLWLIVKKWSSACNLGSDVSPYTLRHSLTRHLLQSGRSQREVQRILGLSSPNSIRVYTSSQFA
jgi:integrase/recombinase XerD